VEEGDRRGGREGRTSVPGGQAIGTMASHGVENVARVHAVDSASDDNVAYEW
jgi:hypothetical protein